MKVLVSLVLVAGLGLGYFQVVVPLLEMNDERFALIESRINILENELSKVRRESNSLGARLDALAVAPSSAQAVSQTEGGGAPSHEREGPPRPERSPVETAASLSMIEGIVALSESERSAIRDALVNAQGEEIEDASLEQIFGAEKFASFQRERAAFEAKVQNESIDRELFSLKSSLELNSEQERAFRELISESRIRYSARRGSPVWESMPKGEAERARYKLMQEESRQEFLLAQAKSILSEAQYNAYLEQQANSVSRRSHTSFLQSLSSQGDVSEVAK